MEVLETDRLLLRPWREDDAEALYKYASDGRVAEKALWPRHSSVEMSRAVIKDFFMPNDYTFAIVLKETGEPIGCIGLVPAGDEHFIPLENERETGYWIGYPYWGMGLTPEALSSIIEFCKNSLHLQSLLITTDASNAASKRVAEKGNFIHIADYDCDGIASSAYRRYL